MGSCTFLEPYTPKVGPPEPQLLPTCVPIFSGVVHHHWLIHHLSAYLSLSLFFSLSLSVFLLICLPDYMSVCLTLSVSVSHVPQFFSSYLCQALGIQW